MENSVDDRGPKESWMSVPAFGDWDKLQGVPNYSMDFSKIRENRRMSKTDYSRMSISNEFDLLSQSITASAAAHRSSTTPSSSAPRPIDDQGNILLHGRKKFLSYFSCCGTKISS